MLTGIFFFFSTLPTELAKAIRQREKIFDVIPALIKGAIPAVLQKVDAWKDVQIH